MSIFDFLAPNNLNTFVNFSLQQKQVRKVKPITKIS